MYTPHTVTLVMAGDDSYNAVVLRGVFLDLSKRSNVNKSGLSDADSATLFIPFSIVTDKAYLPPKEYEAADNKDNYWTLFDGGEESGADCYFIKGEQQIDIYPFSTARAKHDYVYHVTSVDLRDFGSPMMQHWMVGGR